MDAVGLKTPKLKHFHFRRRLLVLFYVFISSEMCTRETTQLRRRISVIKMVCPLRNIASTLCAKTFSFADAKEKAQPKMKASKRKKEISSNWKFSCAHTKCFAIFVCLANTDPTGNFHATSCWNDFFKKRTCKQHTNAQQKLLFIVENSSLPSTIKNVKRMKNRHFAYTKMHHVLFILYFILARPSLFGIRIHRLPFFNDRP